MKQIKKIFGAKYCPESIINNVLFLLVVLILVAACFPTMGKEPELIEYEVGGRVPTDIYIRQFDAWQKGQIELDLEVDRRLAALENPPISKSQVSKRLQKIYSLYKSLHPEEG